MDPQDVAPPQRSGSRSAELVRRMMALLDIDQVSPLHFRAPGLTTEPRRIFGGQLVAQALAAATRTVDPGRLAHSVSATFIRSGLTTLDTEFRVERDADGASFSFRRVLVTQSERPLLSLSASFQAPHLDESHQVAMPQVPAPESLEDDALLSARLVHLSPEARQAISRASPFEFRSTAPEIRFAPGPQAPRQDYWFRTATPLAAADQAAQRIVLTYASDMMLLGAGLLPHGRRWYGGDSNVASLNHAIWIHADVQADDWLFYTQDSPWSGQGRNLSRGHIFDRSGQLVATVSQEAMARPRVASTGR